MKKLILTLLIIAFSCGSASATTTTGLLGDARSFDGSNDSISIADSNDWDFGSGDFSISAYIKTNSAVYGHILEQWAYTGSTTIWSNSAWQILFLAGGNYRLRINDDANNYAQTSAGGLDDNTYHHIFTQRDGSSLKIYVDGAFSASASAAGVIQASTQSVYINSSEDSKQPYFASSIDEVRISSTARSAEWVDAEYNNQNSPSAFINVGTMETQ